MSKLIHYNNCPVCNGNSLTKVAEVKDYTVSQQNFTVLECATCSLRFTQDVPDASTIGSYYKADTYISHTNSSKGFINSIYQKVRKHTLNKKRNLIETVTSKKEGQLLDIGAGTGAFINKMMSAGWFVTGLEPDADARAVARKDFDVNLLPITELQNLNPNSFDAITLWHVLEHVHDLNGYMQQMKKLLKDSGKIFIAVPNYTSKDAETYKEYWAAYDVPRHLYHFSPQSMKVLTEKHGLKVVSHKPMWFDSFYVSMLSSKYKTGSIGYFSALINGIKSNLTARKNSSRCSSLIYIIAPA